MGDRKIGPPAGERKARQGERREAIVGADRGAIDPAGRWVRAERSVAVGGLRSAVARGPHAPALGEGFGDRRLAIDRGIGVTRARRAWLAVGRIGIRPIVFVGELRRAAR